LAGDDVCWWQALGEGQRVGAPGAAELRRLLTSEEEGAKYGGRQAKGKTITPADEVAGQGACRRWVAFAFLQRQTRRVRAKVGVRKGFLGAGLTRAAAPPVA